MSTTTTDPWATTEPSAEPTTQASDPWGSAATDDGQSFMSAADVTSEQNLSLMNPFDEAIIPLEDWIESGVGWLVSHLRPFFDYIKAPIEATLKAVEGTFSATPALLMVAIFALLAWQLSGKRAGIGTLIGMVTLGAIGVWEASMTTLALVVTSVFFCVVIGIPTGIAMARSDKFAAVARPMLDMMQTTPAFVYLVPIVMLFGIGNVPGVVVTIIFAVPPVIRLTNLGIRQVPEDLIEAANSFGADSRQKLFKVQLPLAMPTIMAGINQTLMLGLSMVVIASMISVGGLGLMVLRGIGRLDIGLASVGGLGIVILAIILDRMTQSLGKDARARGTRHWYQTGPTGLILNLIKK